MMNISTKSPPHRAYGFLGHDFLSFSSFLCILVFMSTNETEQYAKNYMTDRRLLQKHF